MSETELRALVDILRQTLAANALRLTSVDGGYVGGGRPHATLDSDAGAVEEIARGLLARKVGKQADEVAGLDVDLLAKAAESTERHYAEMRGGAVSWAAWASHQADEYARLAAARDDSDD